MMNNVTDIDLARINLIDFSLAVNLARCNLSLIDSW